MTIRKAERADIDKIAAIYEAIHDAEAEKKLTVGWWRGIYPTRETAEEGVSRGDMFVGEEDGEIRAAAVINHIQLEEYAKYAWKYEAKDEEIMVLHTLAVDPAAQARGWGRKMAAFYEQYAREQGCRCLRIDTQEKNTVARAFYKKLGYREAGLVLCSSFNRISNIRLIGLEKQL